ncbi:MAG: hypothetical protein CSB44_09495 [Gammaproteobacteria bacterium]|nr:MAG: hypothetical protein CSB44_09495 [Gammaproteobacteria bacterium]
MVMTDILPENAEKVVESRSLSAQIEASALDKENEAIRLERLDRDQRRIIRWAAVGVACLTLVFMAVMLACSLHWMTLRNQDLSGVTSLLVAMIVSPVLSITTITLGLLIGAFRRFKREDEAKAAGLAGSAAITAASGMRGG